MNDDVIKLVKELIKLAKEVENDADFSIEIYAIVLKIMEYSNESISRSVQLSIYITCYEGMIRVSDDKRLTMKLHMDLRKLLEEENDGIHTAQVSDVS